MERRRHTQTDVIIEIKINAAINKKGEGKILNVSESGLFIETSVSVDVHDFIVIALPDKDKMVGITVRRVTTTGFGAEFGRCGVVLKQEISEFQSHLGQSNVSSVVESQVIILLCDPNTQIFLLAELKQFGFTVLETNNIDRVISLTSRFNVVGVVSDYIVNGTSTLSTLRKVKDSNKLPVMVYSGKYYLPNKELAKQGIDCLFKYKTNAKMAALHLKKLIR